MAGDSKKVIVAAMVGNGLIAVSKFVAGFVTGSGAMISEAVHSVADTSNQGLLLYGMRRSVRGATKLHPFGYAVERYFWPFLVAIVIFLLGGLFALYEGIHGLMNLHAHHEGGSPIWNYIVLGAAIVFESGSFYVAIKEFRLLRGDKKTMTVIRETKDPTIPVVLLEDAAALIGLVIALVAVAMTHFTGWAGWDAIGSSLIGVLLCGVAVLLARETHSLLLGESAPTEVREAVLELVNADASVLEVSQLLSLHRGPDDVLLAMKIRFDQTLDLGTIEAAIDRIEETIRVAYPEMTRIFIEPDAGYDHSKDPNVLL